MHGAAFIKDVSWLLFFFSIILYFLLVSPRSFVVVVVVVGQWILALASYATTAA